MRTILERLKAFWEYSWYGSRPPGHHRYAKPAVEVTQELPGSQGIKLSGGISVDPDAPPGERIRGLSADKIICDDRQDLPPEDEAVIREAFGATRLPRDAVAAAAVPKPNYMGPGHPEWKGRAEIPLVSNGWAEPAHPMFAYQQFLKYQNAGVFPPGWKVIGWTPEGVSYVVPEEHWAEAERKSPHPTVRKQHNPWMTPDEVARERLKGTATGLMSDAEIDQRVAQYRAYTTALNEKAAAILDHVRAGAERHARTLLDNNEELYETIAGYGRDQQPRIEAWVKECGQKAVDKRLADSVRLLTENTLLSAIPVDDFIYQPKRD